MATLATLTLDIEDMPGACEAPLSRGERRGQPATGTAAGALRHFRASEPLCAPCRLANNAYYRGRADLNRDKVNARCREWANQNKDKVAAKNRDWVSRNRERSNASRREWNARNKDKVSAYNRRWREAHPEAYEASWKAWREANPERDKANRKAAMAAWRRANPEVVQFHRLKRRALIAKASTVPFTVEQLAARLSMWGGHCWLCGAPGADSVDHVIPIIAGGPHILANLRPAHRSCNSSKGAKKWPR